MVEGQGRTQQRTPGGPESSKIQIKKRMKLVSFLAQLYAFYINFPPRQTSVPLEDAVELFLLQLELQKTEM